MNLSTEPIDELAAQGISAKTGKEIGLIRTLIKQRPSALVGIIIVATLALAGIFAPLLSRYDTGVCCAQNLPPNPQNLLGTDNIGQDMFTLILYGTRISLIVGIAAGTIAMVLGGIIGLLSGYFGGFTDGASMRTADFFLVVPELVLMVIVVAIFGTGLVPIIIVIGLLSWAVTARVIRAQVKTIRERVYVKRARAIGAGHTRLLTRHVLPQTVPLLVANSVLTVAVAIFDETFLSFLGYGPPDSISLGKLIENAFDAAATTNGYWWMVIPPGVAVTLLILGFTLFGQALEDHLNPRLKVSYLSPRSWRIRRTEATSSREAAG